MIPLALLGVAVLAAVVGVRRRPSERRGLWLWPAPTAIVAVATAAAPLAMNVPTRYFWLWEPALPIAAIMLLATLLCVTAIKMARTHTPSVSDHAVPKRILTRRDPDAGSGQESPDRPNAAEPSS